MTLDSVFSPVLARFESYKMPFSEDEPILPRKTIEQGMGEISSSFEDSATKLISNAAFKMADSLDGADALKINKADWDVQRQVRDLLWGLWSSGWELGQQHAAEELTQKLTEPGRFTLKNTWAQFADEVQQDSQGKKGRRKQVAPKIQFDPVERRPKPDNRQFPLKGLSKTDPLRRSYLAQAIDERTLLLSERISDETKEEVKNHIRAHLLGDSATGEKISKLEMRNRIRQTIEGDPSSDEIAQGVRGRARTIGKTEVTGVYSLGRLHKYLDSGRVTKVRYQTFEYANPLKGQRPCMKCMPKNGHILDLQTQWQLIVTTYLIPAHGRCLCSFIPLLDDEGDQLLAAQPGRRARSDVGESLGSWMGFTLTSAGKLVMNEALKQEIARRQSEKARKKQQQMLTGLGLGVLGLSFAGLVYAFFQYWQNRQGEGTGIVVQPGLPPIDRASQALSDITQQRLGQILQEQGEQIRENIGKQEPLVGLLGPSLVSRLNEVGVAPDRVSLEYLKSTGLDDASARRVQSALKVYSDWLKSQPGVRIGGADLNVASVDELVATGYFNDRQARAIVQSTRANPLRSVYDLAKVLDVRGRPIFRQKDIAKYANYWLNGNINADYVDVPFLQKQLGITDRVARTIILERNAAPFLSEDDMAKRLRARRLHPSTVKAVMGKLKNYGIRVDPSDRRLDLPLPLLERPELLLSDRFQQTSQPLQLPPPRLPGEPPVPVDAAAAQARRLAEQQVIRQRQTSIQSDGAKLDALINRRLGAQRRTIEQQIKLSPEEQTRLDRAQRSLQAYNESAGNQIASANQLVDEIEGILNQPGASKYEAMQILNQKSNGPTWLDDKLADLDRQLAQIQQLESRETPRVEAATQELYSSDRGQSGQLIQAVDDRRQEVMTKIRTLISQSPDIQDEISGQGGLQSQISQIRSDLLNPNIYNTFTPSEVERLRGELNQFQQDLWYSSYLKQIDDLRDSLRNMSTSLIGRSAQAKSSLADKAAELQALRDRVQEERNRYRFSRVAGLVEFGRKPKLLRRLP